MHNSNITKKVILYITLNIKYARTSPVYNNNIIVYVVYENNGNSLVATKCIYLAVCVDNIIYNCHFRIVTQISLWNNQIFKYLCFNLIKVNLYYES